MSDEVKIKAGLLVVLVAYLVYVTRYVTQLEGRQDLMQQQMTHIATSVGENKKRMELYCK